MISREIILEILRDACRAPSGDNAQPWRFEVRENTIYVINVPEKDTSLFNYQQVTNHVALGACVENLRVSAEGHGLRVALKLFPDVADRLTVAETILSPDSSMHNELAPYIKERASNRKRHYVRKIEPEKIAELSLLARGETGRIVFISDETEVKEMAHIVSVGEKLALENRAIHDFLFSHVTWTKKEDDKKHGFFIDTFELAPPQKTAFKFFSNWHVLKFFLPLGIANLVANDMKKIYAASATFGAIITSGTSDRDYLMAGMVLERLWLTATKLGLSLHPTTTVHFIGARVLAGDPGSLSTVQQALLRERYNALVKKLGTVEGEGIGFVFRLGYSEAPSGRTTRFEPIVTFED